ncbi:tetratricopeptide repeat protein [Azospira inquinata]|uniref:Tetratricopeptide repeat protein n=1 Tax=Azospira inquinata TaxID=2785627 RepID=A0A975XW10_9RHOO|nr:hypothetical protein [Azospira inquinata]QWT46980.1 hypothetical protein J8L76_04530 [Azospira inquinata]QWT50389.1 hypothetical protein Azoinq_07340 [Azospira inquinata]
MPLPHSPLSVLAGALLLALSALPSLAAGASESPAAPTGVRERLEQIRENARQDPAATARALAAMAGEPQTTADRATWLRLSREAAVRNGDRTTLEALKNGTDPFSLRALAHVLAANGYLDEGNFAAARQELAQVQPLEAINTRDQRRYWALRARLAQLEGREGEEREALEHIVHELAHWTSAECQSCHNDPKQPQAIPALDLTHFWFGQRLVLLMQRQGDALRVQRQAEQRLAADPKDLDARILRGYALLAQHRPREAEQCFRAIPWAAFPDRPGTPPRMMFLWP